MNIYKNKNIYQELDDIELLSFVKESNNLAFEELYNRYWRKLLSYAIQKTQSVETSKEIIQELFINIWERREGITVQNLEKYLFSSVKYKVIFEIKNRYQNNELNTKVQESNLTYHDNYPTEINDLNNLIDSCLSELPNKTKEIFIKSRREEMTHKEISFLYDISEKSVEYHISQAIKALRVSLKDFISIAPIILKFILE